MSQHTYRLTGQLFLGTFSGPVEGILIIVGIYAVTGYYGQFYIRLPLERINPRST